jgi:hypothetical protein
LVAAAARKSRIPPNTRLTIGNYIADILVDGRQPSILCHWIVQRIGSAEILHWGQESTFAEAEEAATEHLRALDEKERQQA